MRQRQARPSTAQNRQIIQEIKSVEDMPPIVDDIIQEYCEKNDVDESDIPPTVWDDILFEIYITLFKPCWRLLKVPYAKNNEYDKDAVRYVYNNIYKRISNKHCQEIYQLGFCTMTGIERNTLYTWLNTQGYDLQQNIMNDNERSLNALMQDRRCNVPTKYLAKLNKVHGYNMPGAPRYTNDQRQLGVESYPKLLPPEQQKPQDVVVAEQIESKPTNSTKMDDGFV